MSVSNDNNHDKKGNLVQIMKKSYDWIPIFFLLMLNEQLYN